mgnify:CR=1 FL=1
MLSLLNKVDSSSEIHEGRKVISVRTILDNLKDFEVDESLEDHEMSTSMVDYVQELLKPLESLSSDERSDEEEIKFNHLTLLQSACEDFRNNSIYKLEGQPRLDATIKHFILEKVPEHTTLTGTYNERRFVIFRFTLNDLSKAIRVTKEMV